MQAIQSGAKIQDVVNAMVLVNNENKDKPENEIVDIIVNMLDKYLNEQSKSDESEKQAIILAWLNENKSLGFIAKATLLKSLLPLRNLAGHETMSKFIDIVRKQGEFESFDTSDRAALLVNQIRFHMFNEVDRSNSDDDSVSLSSSESSTVQRAEMEPGSPVNDLGRLQSLDVLSAPQQLGVEYLKAHDLWLLNINKLNENNKKISEIDAELSSATFRAKQYVGWRTAEELNISRTKLLEENICLESLILSTHKLVQTLEQHAKEQNAAHISKSISEMRDSCVAEYSKDSKYFFERISALKSAFSSNLGSILVNSELQAEIQSMAIEILYAKQEFTADVSLLNYSDAYYIVNVAKQLSIIKYDESLLGGKLDVLHNERTMLLQHFYTSAAGQVFNSLVDRLPVSNNSLRTLYLAEKFELVDEYLNDLVPAININDNETIADISRKISVDAEKLKFAKAKAVLSINIGFNKLPSDVQNSLIEQQMFIAKLELDALYAEQQFKSIYIQELDKYSKKLASNISNVIDNYLAENQAKQDFEDIKQQIDAKSNKLRTDIYVDQAKDTAKVGAGIFALSFITPPLAVAAAGYMVYQKAKVERERSEAPEILAERELLDSVQPVDFKYIKQQDSFWNGHESSDSQKQPAEGTSILNQITGDVKKFVGKKTDEITTSVNVETNRFSHSLTAGLKVLTGLSIVVSFVFIVATIAMLAVGVGFPPVWPFLAALGFGLVIAETVFVVKYGNYTTDPTKTPLDLIVDAIDFPARIISKIFSVPIASILANFSEGRNKSGYVIVGSIFALVITGAVLLPLLAPVLGIAGGVVLGATAGAVLGTYLGAAISEFLGFKRTSQSVLRDLGITNQASAFNLSRDSEQKLNSMYPAFANKLVEHFESRARQLELQINEAKQSKSVDATANITAALDTLESDWKSLTKNIADPKEFCQNLDQYLDKRYQAERQEYVAGSAARKEQRYDPSIKRTTMLFEKSANSSAFEMQHAVDYKKHRSPIDELHDLKSIVRDIKKRQN